MNLSLLVIPSTANDPQPIETPEASSEKAQTDSSESLDSSQKQTSISGGNAVTQSISDKTTQKNPTKSSDDDDEFRRDRFATPLTATRIDHGIKDVLGGSERTVGRGTLGRGRGKGIRKALFAVDVPAEEDEDEVDTHVEHISVPSEQEGIDAKASSPQQAPVNGVNANGTNVNEQTASTAKEAKDAKNDDEDRCEEPITTADGIEFNV